MKKLQRFVVVKEGAGDNKEVLEAEVQAANFLLNLRVLTSWISLFSSN